MALNVDREILADFLVEAGEILEVLSEQLVQLEKSPNDYELLNAIFRGFHTIKGGAGFLQLTPLVDCCHNAENLFDSLRNNEIEATSEVMDAVIEAFDEINDMFDVIKTDDMPSPAPAELLERLKDLAEGKAVSQAASVEESVPEETKEVTPVDHKDSEEFEFDYIFEATNKSRSEDANSDEITEEEFDKLLDKLEAEGKGAFAHKDSSAKDSTTVVDEKNPVNVSTPSKTDKVEKANGKLVTESNIRVDTYLLDNIMTLVGELVLIRNRMMHLGGEIDNEEISKTIASFDMVTSDLQLSVMRTRMQPVKKVFGRFPRLIRDLSKSLNKDIELVLKGEETGLDKNLVEALADPLVHLVRNSADHGIEMPSVREAAGKRRTGTVTLSAEQEGDHILLLISDDGAGMDAEVLKRKAIEKGVIDEEMASVLSDNEAYNLIFHAGFSTASEVSDISGRGVGMDVVKTKINQLNGSVDIDSRLGEGTTIKIKVPLTLAIMPALMVGISKHIFALPLVNVDEIFDMDLRETNIVDGQETILIRGKAYPLIHIKRWLTNEEDAEIPERAQVVLVSVGGNQCGFIVDVLYGQEEVVIKPLDSILHGTPGISGATITGDGGISLIIDIPSLISHYSGKGK